MNAKFGVQWTLNVYSVRIHICKSLLSCIRTIIYYIYVYIQKYCLNYHFVSREGKQMLWIHAIWHYIVYLRTNCWIDSYIATVQIPYNLKDTQVSQHVTCIVWTTHTWAIWIAHMFTCSQHIYSRTCFHMCVYLYGYSS